ncbi:vacuolar-processing enzyme gamma-isozyme-like [Bidens hawaiensis]|uniref:vacuolar-processing enzyme gamma-isozyme-like n=1 Tax=Bidens hawaiensis TaxID=980011 RepID=UPI00404AC27F
MRNPPVSNIWAILIAGSTGWINYADQAMVCYAYQLLKNGGIEDENIIVFMQDDIADNANNDRQHAGSIYYEGRYNTNDGYEGTTMDQGGYRKDVYEGVPKDYTGDFMTIANLKGVLYGDRSRVKGGSGKVLNTTSHDTIFFYCTGHGDGEYLGKG